MNSETKQAETTTPKVDAKFEEGGAITKIQSSEQSQDRWQQIIDQVLQILSELPAYIGGFFADYQKPLLTIVFIITAAISLKVMLAVLDAINDVPLLAPTFELIGITYTAWFVNRYLLRAENRQELSNQFNNLKNKVLGQ